MAIYHLSVKPVSRAKGRSSTAAAAYRAADRITDERTGEIHDYTRRTGVESAGVVLPDGAAEWAADRSALWNAAEAAEKRKDACVAREFEVALPAELSPEERRQLATDFAKDMANRERCAVDVAIHAPGKGGDNRNHHAHILRTTRKVEAGGLGAKLDTEKAGRKRAIDLEAVRERWAVMTNEALKRVGHEVRVDHRSLKGQGIEAVPTRHLGPSATAMERRGEPTDRGDLNRAAVQVRGAQGELNQAEKMQRGTTAARAATSNWTRAKEEAERQKEVERQKQERQRENDRSDRQREERLKMIEKLEQRTRNSDRDNDQGLSR